jgi:hypothetical protein
MRLNRFVIVVAVVISRVWFHSWPGMISAYEIDEEVPLQKRSRFLEIDPDEESDNYWKRFYPDLRPLPVNFPRRQSEP